MIFCRYSRDRLYQKLIDIYSRKGAENAEEICISLDVICHLDRRERSPKHFGSLDEAKRNPGIFRAIILESPDSVSLHPGYDTGRKQ